MMRLGCVHSWQAVPHVIRNDFIDMGCLTGHTISKDVMISNVNKVILL
jgi:hypothetical protein